MKLEITRVNKEKSHIRENGVRVIYFELSEKPDNKWCLYFNHFYEHDPNNYKGHSMIEGIYITVTTDYPHMNQIKDCVRSAVHNANNEYQKRSHEEKVRQENRKQQMEKQQEKRGQDYEDFKKQLDAMKFNDSL
jgi:hypothetical protein